MEPEGITLFTECGTRSAPQRKCRLQVRQGCYHRSVLNVSSDDESSLCSKDKSHQRKRFQKPRPLPFPGDDSLFPEVVQQTEKANREEVHPIAGLPLEGAKGKKFYEDIEPRPLRRSMTIAECRSEDQDAPEHSNLASRRSMSIRVRSSSKRDFQPKRNKIIQSKFSDVDYDYQESEIWVETFTSNDDGKVEYYFKGLRGSECCREPPTGAMNIVYLEDILTRQADDPFVRREMAMPSIVKKAKKRPKTKWTSFVHRCKSIRKHTGN